MNATLSPGVAYDAVSILGFGPANADPLPKPVPGEFVIRYGGWSLQQLRDTNFARLMQRQDWYNQYPWSTQKLPAGIYRLRVPVPDSNRKTFVEQQAMLPPEEQVAPVVLVATVLLAHRLLTREDLLNTDYTHCREQAAVGFHVALAWDEGWLYVNSYWDVYRRDFVWVSSLREC